MIKARRMFKYWFHLIVISSIVLTFSILNGYHTVTTNQQLSQRENRALTPFPSLSRETLFSGEFASQVDGFINDRLLFRDQFLDWQVAIDSLKGIPKEDVQIFTVQRGDLFNGYPEEAGEPKEPDKPEKSEPLPIEDKSDTPEITESPEIVEDPPAPELPREGLINSFLVIKNRGFELPRFKESSARYYVDSLKSYTNQIDLSIPVYSIIVPSGFEFHPPSPYDHLGKNQKQAIQYFHDQLGNRFIPVDAYEALQGHEDEYLFFRTDHHWTARGAHYVYQAFAKKLGFSPYPLEQFETRSVEGFLGSLYNQTLSPALKATPDRVTAYLPFVDYEYHVDRGKGKGFEPKPVIDFSLAGESNKYQIFISSDSPLAVIKNNVPAKNKILIFKDSYGNAFIPFLMPHYREIHIIDPRYYQKNVVEYTETHGIDHVLFFNYFPVISIVNGFAYNVRRVVTLPRESPDPVAEEETPGAIPSASADRDNKDG